MASFLSLQQALDQANHAAEEIRRYSQLHPEDLGAQVHPQSFADVPAAVRSPRKQLAEAAARLLQLTTDPREYLEQLAANNQHLVCIRWLINLHILQHIPIHESITYAKLAALSQVPEHQLKSVVRMAAAHGFLYEVDPASVSHSPNSNLIATNPSFLNWASFLVNYSVPSSFRFPEATKKWGHTEKKNETAFNIAMDVREPFFEHLKVNDDMNAIFSSYMRNVTNSEATSLNHLIEGFDWKSLRPGATVVDVGGSGGHASAALSSAFPYLNFIVQDLPETIANAKAASPKHTEVNGDSTGMGNRVRFMPHDFFTPQPVTDADVYLLRMIIHDWPDNTAITILRHLKDALKRPGSKILVMDTILPQPGTVSLLQERQLRVRDLTMMQVFNAKEREYEAWKELVDKAGLTILNVRQPEGSNMGILELGPTDANSDDRDSSGSLTPTNSSGNISPSEIVRLDSTLLDPGNSMPAAASAISRVIPSDNHRALGKSCLTKDDAELNTCPLVSDPNFEKTDLPVLIIGAGISGLCLAQHLRKNSIPFQVLERDVTEQARPQGYRLKLEADAADALRESLTPEMYRIFETSCAISAIGETDFDPISGACIKSRAGGGLAGSRGLRSSHTVDRAVFRRILMTGIEDKIQFARSFVRFKKGAGDDCVTAEFEDGSTIRGRFIVGADGARSPVRRQYLPSHSLLDTEAICIYGKTIMTPDLLQRYPARGLRWMSVCADTAPLVQSILIGESPLTLLTEPIRFSTESRAQTTIPLPEDYVYWVLIGRKELFMDSEAADRSSEVSAKACDTSAEASAAQSLLLTGEWHPTLRSLFELQDARQCSTMRVVSAPPNIPEWQPSSFVTLIGDAVHAMSPCGGVGANTALRDAAELGKLFADVGNASDLVEKVGAFEKGLRKRAFAGLMRSFVGSKKMFGQQPFEDLSVVEE